MASLLTIRDAYKTFNGKDYILRGLNMNVKESQIFCLLGASGCGKSTLLNLIVGLMDLDGGIIETTIKSRAELGYMTQETSLYEQLSTREAFYYYGTVYGLTNKEIKREMDKFCDLLDLPNLDLCVQVLSGGQRRRVSLAMALLHKPRLLLLDEPTVGIDSLLRNSIWNYLLKLCVEEKKTIIITTHYIDEGKHAHTIGYMRNGLLLCENSPKYLMEKNEENNLETIFLKLCTQQVPPAKLGKKRRLTFSKQPYSLRLRASGKLHSCKINGEIKKNYIYLKRNLCVSALTLLIPAFSAIIFSFTCGRDPEGLKFGIVTDEIPSGLSNCNSLTRKDTCNFENLSCIYAEKLKNKTLQLQEYDDVSTAINDVKTNKIWGVMHFPQNYSNAIYTIIDNILTNDSSVFNNRAHLYMDYSNLKIHDLLLRDVREGYADMLKEVYHNCSWPIEAAQLPIKFETPVFGEATPNFRIYYASPVVTMLLLVTPLMAGLTIMIEEKRVGATARSIIAGVNIFEIFVAHFAFQLCLQVFQTVIVVGTLYGILGFPFKQPYLSTLLLVLQNLIGIAMSFTVASLTDSVNVCCCLQVGLSMITMLIGGLMWPLEAIPIGIRFFSWILPSTFPTESLRSLTIRNNGLEDYVVKRGFISSLLWIFVLTLFTIVFIKKTRGRSFVKI